MKNQAIGSESELLHAVLEAQRFEHFEAVRREVQERSSKIPWRCSGVVYGASDTRSMKSQSERGTRDTDTHHESSIRVGDFF
jgi:hypothetical protein